ncbi:MAG: hypothetical protein QOJ29_3331, partial [Thermoleophilaceae bacterium]|nr:hypothetical protein [Thermoleophilaceae bacterium]
MLVLATASFLANAALFVFLLIFSVGLVYGYFTISGSAINNHPHNGRDGAPGANRPDEIHAYAEREAG